MMRKARAVVLQGLLAALFGGGLLVGPGTPFLTAQEVKVPVEIQFDLLTKILIFDRNLKARAGDEIVVGLVYQSLYRESLQTKDEFLRAAADSRDMRIEGLAVRFIAIELKTDSVLEDLLSANSVDVLYVTPLRAYNVAAIAAVCRARGILTMTGVPEYARESLAVGIDSVGGRPRILINLNGAKAEGCDFSSKLLNLATVIK